jgi:hypothetical protein
MNMKQFAIYFSFIPGTFLAVALLVSLTSCTAPEPESNSEQLLIDAKAERLNAADFRARANIAKTGEEAALLEAQAQEAESWAIYLEDQAQ